MPWPNRKTFVYTERQYDRAFWGGYIGGVLVGIFLGWVIWA